MERNAVLAKTPKGQSEVKSRTHGLAQKLRSVLIMVDGSATAGDILAKCGGIPDVEAALESLVSEGFVEIRGANAVAAASPAVAAPGAPSLGATQPMPSPVAPTAPSLGATQPIASPAAPTAPPLGATQPIPSPAAPAQSREEAMAGLKRFLVDNLGSHADAQTGALERAPTRAEFHVAAERCAHALAAAHGASTAQAFRDRAKAYLDAHVADG